MILVNIKKICTSFKNTFTNRIICLLYYGSHAYNREIKPTSDFDLCLVLDTRKTKDLNKIREIIKPFSQIDLTLHYLDELEQDGWENFQSDNHGVFYLFHFATAQTIIGDNIFSKKLNLIPSTKVIASLRRQIIEYFWRLDNAIFSLSNEELIVSDIFRKYSIRILQDLLVARGEISFTEINQINYTDFYDKFIKNNTYIHDQTKHLLNAIIHKEINSVNDIIKLKELLYKDFRNNFNNNRGHS